MRSTSPPSDATFPTTLPLRILTHNIRYATSAPFPGELPWPERREHVVAELRYHTRYCATSIICLQEVLHAQLLDILAGLNSAAAAKDPGPPAAAASSPPPAQGPWRHVGVGRDDGQTGGEYSPLLYRSDVWRVERSFTMWLSTRPWEPGSKGWDAASVRIVTVAVLAHRGCGRRVLAANTHLDDQGSVSRREGARLIVRTLRKILAEGRVEGGFLAGDLNSEIGGEAYRVLNEERSGLVDFRVLVGREAYGDEMTYTGYYILPLFIPFSLFPLLFSLSRPLPCGYFFLFVG
jgi:endonuclease/exonuclease/phosphatase family metal-dependent hydrolase